ncbi:MAG: ACP S-malonyltransferase [Polyangiaceae bacterium]|jgi:[acyl-carrier-protein] S-malonyltransferase
MSIAWLFPGQGSQFVGMCKDVVKSSTAAHAILERANHALGESLSELILEGPDDRLTLTVNAQPALVATSCAVLEAIRERLPGLPLPAFAAGHSLGEYSALVAGEALCLEDAVRLVRTRGRAMQEAVAPGTGTMSAIVGMDPERLEAICAQAAEGSVVAPANFNAPGQVVVAGHAAAVARVGELVISERGRAIPLKVSAPFHCALMAPAARTLEAELALVNVLPPRFPIVANFNAQANIDPSRTRELLVRQVDGPVRWDASVRFMVAHGVTHALEIGPGKVLAGLVKRIAKEVKVLSVGDLASLGELHSFMAEATSR